MQENTPDPWQPTKRAEIIGQSHRLSTLRHGRRDVDAVKKDRRPAPRGEGDVQLVPGSRCLLQEGAAKLSLFRLTERTGHRGTTRGCRSQVETAAANQRTYRQEENQDNEASPTHTITPVTEIRDMR